MNTKILQRHLQDEISKGGHYHVKVNTSHFQPFAWQFRCAIHSAPPSKQQRRNIISSEQQNIMKMAKLIPYYH